MFDSETKFSQNSCNQPVEDHGKLSRLLTEVKENGQNPECFHSVCVCVCVCVCLCDMCVSVNTLCVCFFFFLGGGSNQIFVRHEVVYVWGKEVVLK